MRRAKPGEFQHVAEPLRGNQGNPRAPPFNDGVGRDGRGVRNLCNLARRHVIFSQQRLDAFTDGAGVIIRRRQHFLTQQRAILRQ